MNRMPPPGTDTPKGKGVAIIIGVPHGKDSGGNGRMPPPGSDAKPAGAKASRDEAGYVAQDAHCIDCSNFSPDTGECSKVEGTFDADAACVHYFEPTDEESSESPQQEASEDESAEGQGA